LSGSAYTSPVSDLTMAPRRPSFGGGVCCCARVGSGVHSTLAPRARPTRTRGQVSRMAIAPTDSAAQALLALWTGGGRLRALLARRPFRRADPRADTGYLAC